MSKTLKYNNYSLTYDEYLLGYADVLGSEDSGIYLRIPGSFTDVKLKLTGKSNIQIDKASTPCFSWIDPSTIHIFFTIEKNPQLGAPVYTSEFNPRTGPRTRIAGYVSKPNVVVIPLIVVQPDSGSETIKLERINSETVINDQSYSIWKNDTLEESGMIGDYYCLSENPIEVGTKVYYLNVSLTLEGTSTSVMEYGTIIEYKPGLIEL